MRVITLNVNGIRSADRRGLARWLARIEPWDVVCLQELRADEADVPRALRAPRKCQCRVPPGTAQGLCGRRRVREAGRDVRDGIRRQRIRRRGTLPAGRFRGAVGDQPVPAFRFQRTAPAGVQIPLSRCVPAASRQSCAEVEAGDHSVRRLEHRAPADRPHELAQQPEEFRLPARGAGVADARFRRAGIRRRVPQVSTRGRSNTRGGRTAATRGRRTSAGASTTRSPRPASPRRRMPRRSTRIGGFRIMRR